MSDDAQRVRTHKLAIVLASSNEIVVLDPARGVVELPAGELRVGDEVLVQVAGRPCFRRIVTTEATDAPGDTLELPADALGPGAPKNPMRVSAAQNVAVAFPAGEPVQAASVDTAKAPLSKSGPAKSSSKPPPDAWLRLAIAEADRLIAGGIAIVVPEDQPVEATPLDTGPPLRALVGIRELPIDEATQGDDRIYLRFTVPPRTTTLRLSSPFGRPLGEQRKLGVAIVSILLDNDTIPLDSPALIRGFHSPEANEAMTWRWTDGEALLVLTPKPARQTLTVVTTNWHQALQAEEKNT